MARQLPRLPPNFGQMSDRDTLLQRYWEDLCRTLEEVPAIAAALETAVTEAQAAADAAQAAADTVGSDTSIANSWVEGLTLEAFNDGADCHVDISDHLRKYGDGTSVSVDGGTLGAIAHDTVVRVFYHDAARAGGAVTYEWTTDPTAAAQTGDVHSVGSTVTPRATEMGSVIGSPVYPPGYSIP